jgi:hypothetical protein
MIHGPELPPVVILTTTSPTIPQSLALAPVTAMAEETVMVLIHAAHHSLRVNRRKKKQGRWYRRRYRRH